MPVKSVLDAEKRKGGKTPSIKEFQLLILGLANRLRDTHGETYAVALASDRMEEAATYLQDLKR